MELSGIMVEMKYDGASGVKERKCIYTLIPEKVILLVTP